MITWMTLHFLEMYTWMILRLLYVQYLDDTPAPWQSLRCSVSGNCSQTAATPPPGIKTINYADGNGHDQNEEDDHHDDKDGNGLNILQSNSGQTSSCSQNHHH